MSKVEHKEHHKEQGDEKAYKKRDFFHVAEFEFILAADPADLDSAFISCGYYKKIFPFVVAFSNLFNI